MIIRDFTTMVLHKPGARAEILTRRGHLDLKTGLALASSGGRTLHAMRHMQLPTPKSAPQLVRVVPIR